MPFPACICVPVLLRRGSTLLILAVAGGVAGCGSANVAEEATKVTPIELPTVAADLVSIQPLPWPETVRAQGSLMADELSIVGTKVPGKVAGVHVDLGDPVRAGQKLVTLDQAEFELRILQAEAALSQAFAVVGLKPGDDVAQLDREQAPPAREAIAVWEKAKADLVRNRELFASTALTEVELEQSVTAERVAEARYASTLNSISTSIAAIQVRSAELAMARQQLADTVIEAPFDGMVQQRHVAPGTFVSVGQPIVTVVRTSRLRFRATLPERHAHRLTLGQQVRLHVESLEEPRLARITRISPVVDELSRSLMFEADVDNSDGRIRSGLFAEAEVIVDPSAESIVVNSGAIVEFAGVEKVWKVVDGKSQEQVVSTGGRRNGEVQILDGLSPGDVVMLDGKQGRPARISAKSLLPMAKMTAAATSISPAGGEKDPGTAKLPSTE